MKLREFSLALFNLGARQQYGHLGVMREVMADSAQMRFVLTAEEMGAREKCRQTDRLFGSDSMRWEIISLLTLIENSSACSSQQITVD